MVSFEKEGWVSIWVATAKGPKGDMKKDVMKDLCGCDYYDVDFQENIFDPKWKSLPIATLIDRLSYSESYRDAALKAAKKKGIDEAVQAISQLEFKYDPKKVTKPVSKWLIFLGAFRFTASPPSWEE